MNIIDKQGLHKSPTKVLGIMKASKPQNVQQLRTFLGMANYYNKFIPNLATILNPLNKLLQRDTEFKWTKECNISFNKVKEEITSEKVLAHYNPEQELILATDASPFGLGAILSHRYEDGTERPIAFASRALNKSERHYS